MPANEALSQRKLSMQLLAPTEKALIAAILIVFLLLHILAGAVLRRADAGDGVTLEQDFGFQLYD